MWFRKKNKELEKIRAEFDCRTADYHGEDIWDLRDFLMLLNIADHDRRGKSKAIIYAYKLGAVEARRRNALGKIKQYLSGSSDDIS